MKTCDLTGYELDYYTGIALGKKVIVSHKHRFCLLDGDIETHEKPWGPSGNWSITGRLIEKMEISLIFYDDHNENESGWKAVARKDDFMFGPTPLIAACRYIVHSIIGDEVAKIEDENK